MALAIRLSVFVIEQGVPLDEEVDAHDAEAVHVLADLGGQDVGRAVITSRAAALYRADGGPACGAPRRRGQRDPLRAAGPRAGYGLDAAALAAQLHARPFYARFGFVAGGPLFLDGGIMHQRMERPL